MLLADDCLENISGLGDVRQVDLGLDFVSFSAGCTRGLCRGCLGPEVSPHLLRFMFFQRTGVRFLLGNSDLCKHIENGLALDFQFSGQIVDSNLAHPPSISSKLSPLSLHINLTASISVPRDRLSA